MSLTLIKGVPPRTQSPLALTRLQTTKKRDAVQVVKLMLKTDSPKAVETLHTQLPLLIEVLNIHRVVPSHRNHKTWE
jgi:acetolactate synthase regulatory subunit